MANRKVIEKWVAALESGKYEQTTGTLRDDEGFCCLGVLTELAVNEGVVPPATMTEDGWSYIVDDRGHLALPPTVVREWAGLDEEMRVEATVTDDVWNDEADELVEVEATRKVELTDLNDSRGFSFKDIAAALRAEHLSGDSHEGGSTESVLTEGK